MEHLVAHLGVLPKQQIPAAEEEKEAQIRTVENVQQAYAEEGKAALRNLQEAANRDENMFAVLMEATSMAAFQALHRPLSADPRRRCGAVHHYHLRFRGPHPTRPFRSRGQGATTLDLSTAASGAFYLVAISQGEQRISRIMVQR